MRFIVTISFGVDAGDEGEAREVARKLAYDCASDYYESYSVISVAAASDQSTGGDMTDQRKGTPIL